MRPRWQSTIGITASIIIMFGITAFTTATTP
ncbi:hypothetical protein MesloDRAFT_1484 [Mesorhizobium japonicum R7A]|nr:hypothetical protein MesloDRAFT_1484 [Mesorhizobium japonicum R7A]